jgi:diguanylate cyclase (GGDEF)-like protein/PAS domain S-box-containing protein
VTEDLRNELEALTHFLYLAPVGMMRFTRVGRVQLINPMASQLLDPRAECDPADAYALLAPWPDLAARLAAFPEEAGRVVENERAGHEAADGRALVLNLNVQRIDPIVHIATIKDVTEVAAQERRSLHDAQRFHAILDGVQDYCIYMLDPNGCFTEWNRSLERMGGWRRGDVEGVHLSMLFPDAGEIRDLLETARRDGAAEREGWRLRRDGSVFWANSVITALHNDTGAVTGFVGIARDLTERKRMEDELRTLSVTDPLTGAFNRRHGRARLGDELAKWERYQIPLAVLMIDIDRFKAINDTYGHEAGDQALRTLAGVCTATLRLIDVFVRWGGEEFLAILPGTDAAAARATAERLRAEVAARHILAEGIRFTISIGVAEAEDTRISALINRADAALYAAKQAGRDRVVSAGPALTVA